MREEDKKRWLIKDSTGRVRGPFFTDEILKRISGGEFSGDELIALYPGTNWISISNDPQFYDRLLESLDIENAQVEQKVRVAVDVPLSNTIEDEFLEKPTVPPPKNRAERVNQSKPSNEKISPKEPFESSEKLKKGKKEKEKITPDIELENIKKVVKKVKLKKSRLPLLIVTVVFALLLAFILVDSESHEDRLRLLAPRSGEPALSDQEIKEYSKKAIEFYKRDTFSNYVAAQSELVKILEGAPRNAGIVALTCLTYLELWPYAFQDSSDIQTISIVTQMASRIDPAGIESATCRAVDSLVRGRYVEAKGIVEMILDTFGRTNNPPIAFYYLKAKLFEATKDYSSAISYAQSAQQLWPSWLRVFALEAALLVKSGNYSEAANKYRGLLKLNPNHRVARIELGLIELRHLKNAQQGQSLLEIGMKQDEKVPRDVLSNGFMGLAELALFHQDSKLALEYAQKAYSLNSANKKAEATILQIGGQKKLKETLVGDKQLMYEGDQLVIEGDCNGAQAHYKTAFELNPKNGLAAMKAGECLWQLSLSTEALNWLNNAIKADPKLVDAYVLLADYYTQRYNYLAAGQILAKAKAQVPNSYKIFRGFALVELRRNNAKGALTYAEKAIQLYEADVESYVVLAQAQIGVQAFAKAFEAASKAIEIDMNNRRAQVVYAQALASTRGVHNGIDYLNRLVNTYPTITEYRMALGQLYMRDQSYSSAQRIFAQVVRIDDKPKEAFIELGKALQAQKQYNQAKDAFFQAAKIDPSDVEALFLAGQLYLEAGQPGEARQQFQRVLRVNKDYPLVNFFIGKAALLMGSAEEAVNQANLEKARNPNLADPYLLAADAFTELKQYSACAGEYLYAVKLRPADSQIHIKMARCYRLAGNLDAAVSMINQASMQESGNPEVWKEQGSIYEMRQDSVKAIEAYNQYLVLAPNAPDRSQIEARIQTLAR